MSTTRRTVLEVTGLFFCSLFLFTYGLGSQEIIGFESRFYLFALEMWRYGLTWFPTTYHSVYPDYPATSTWLIIAAAHILGMNKLAAVLPSAIAASITMVLTYQIGALHHKRWGLYAIFLMVLTLGFLKSARSISLDMYPTMITAFCFYLVYSADVKNKPQRALWIYLFLFIGFAFRGPIGLVVPTGVICVYYLLEGRIKKLFIMGFLALILLAASSALLLGLAYHEGGQVFVQDVLRMQVVGRIDNHFLPPYFYFVDSLSQYALSFPLACLTLLGLGCAALTRHHQTLEAQFLLKLLGWMLIILIGLSIPGDKKIRYILPFVPAAALLAAYPFMGSTEIKYFSWLRKILMLVFALFPVIFLLAILYVSSYASQHSFNLDLHETFLIIILLILQIMSLGAAYCFAQRAVFREAALLLIATISFAFVYISVYEPIELYLDRAKGFVARIEVERVREHARLVFYKERPDGLPIKYLINMPQAMSWMQSPLFVEDEAGLMEIKSPTFFITSASYFAELPKETRAKFSVVAKDSLGHIEVVVFKRK